MEKAIQSFITYFHRTRGSSENTESSYRSDLTKLSAFLEEKGITSWDEVTFSDLTSYQTYQKEQHYAASSMSRSAASIRSFFRYLYKKGKITADPAEGLSSPHIEKKPPQILSVTEVERLLAAPDVSTDKGRRDKAMLELLYATGIRVSELISLRTDDLNMKMNYIMIRGRKKERIIPFGQSCGRAMRAYLTKSKDHLAGSSDVPYLFTNVQGRQMTRQGFWKILKGYAETAAISADITPHTLRHSFAMHMLQNGADLDSLKDMLGHSDISTTQYYAQFGLSHMREVYNRSHPRR